VETSLVNEKEIKYQGTVSSLNAQNLLSYSNFYSYKVAAKNLNVYLMREGVILSVFSLVFLQQNTNAVH
jgi:hypothetical protein